MVSELIPYIPPQEYENTAESFLLKYCPDALKRPMAVPICDIAVKKMGLNIIEVCLSEELDVYGATVFSEGIVETYNPEEMLYEEKVYKPKTILIDPEAVKITNEGCKNNTIAHECVHWWKHRMYHRMEKYVLLRQAKYCKCRVNQSVYSDENDAIMETQAIAIAPRILMPREPFIYAARELNIKSEVNDYGRICDLAEFFQVSRQSTVIRLHECQLI